MERRKIVYIPHEDTYKVLKPSKYSEDYNRHGKTFRGKWSRSLRDYIIGLRQNGDCQFDIDVTDQHALDWINQAIQYVPRKKRPKGLQTI